MTAKEIISAIIIIFVIISPFLMLIARWYGKWLRKQIENENHYNEIWQRTWNEINNWTHYTEKQRDYFFSRFDEIGRLPFKNFEKSQVLADEFAKKREFLKSKLPNNGKSIL